MKIIRGVGVAAVLGAGFGAATSLINDLSSPYGELGGGLVRARWTWVTEVAEVGSLLLDVGWAWAAVAVAAGWLGSAGAIGRGAAAGAVSLIAATAASSSWIPFYAKSPLPDTSERRATGGWRA